MLVTCLSTARSLITSCSAIAAFGHQLEHLALAWRHLPERILAAAAPEELGHHLGVERGAARTDAADGVDEALDVGDAVLSR